MLRKTARYFLRTVKTAENFITWQSEWKINWPIISTIKKVSTDFWRWRESKKILPTMKKMIKYFFLWSVLFRFEKLVVKKLLIEDSDHEKLLKKIPNHKYTCRSNLIYQNSPSCESCSFLVRVFLFNSTLANLIFWFFFP